MLTPSVHGSPANGDSPPSHRPRPPASLLLCAALGFLLTACQGPVRVGAIVSETGAAAYYGSKVRRGLDLALDEINAEGGFRGRRLVLLYRDDATNPEIGLQVAEELIRQEGVRIVVGAIASNVTLRIAPLCEREKVLLLSPTASSPLISAAGEYVFRTCPSDTLEGISMAEFGRDVGLHRVVVLAMKNDLGRSLGDVFAQTFSGPTRRVLARLEFDEGRPETFGPLVEACAELQPDGIYLVAYSWDAAELARQIRKTGGPVLLLASASATTEVARRAGPAAENLVLPLPSFDPEADDPTVRRFVEAYRRRYREEPDAYAAHGYDALRVLLEGMKRAGSPRPEDLRTGLIALDDYQGPCGRTAFDPNGDAVQYPRLYIVRKGTPIPYERFVAEGGTLQVQGR